MVGTRRVGVGVAAAVFATVGLWLALGSSAARSAAECQRVSGHLLNLHHVDPNTAVGRMVGGLQGKYEFTFGPIGGSDPNATVLFGTANARISTDRGELTWHESNAYDYARQDGYNNAILATVTDGTGAWSDASGHVILWGYFHNPGNTGELDYEGEVCSSSA